MVDKPKLPRRFAGGTFVYTNGANDPSATLGALKSIPTGHVVYSVRVLNTDAANSATLGTNRSADYTLVKAATIDFFFCDPSLITFGKNANAVTLDIVVSGEFPGSCPICDGASG